MIGLLAYRPGGEKLMHEKLYAIIAAAGSILVLGWVLPTPLPIPIMVGVALVVFFVLGLAFGLFWPGESWRWSIWLTAPVVVILAMDLLIGTPEMIMRDLIFTACAIVGGALGGLIGAVRGSRAKQTEVRE